MRFKGIIAYDGTDFQGWQAQVGKKTIQGLLHERLEFVLRAPVRVHGSGRTDAGVHAKMQVFHFDANWKHPRRQLLNALRSGLPEAIVLRSLTATRADFHARRSARRKQYIYRIFEGYPLPMEGRYGLVRGDRPRLDVAAMQTAAAFLVGRHDFAAFAANRGNGSNPESTVRHLMRLDVLARGPRIRIVAEANGFLYKMVRSLAGALIDAGTGKLQPGDLKTILHGGTRTALIPTAPPQGLTLERVFY